MDAAVRRYRVMAYITGGRRGRRDVQQQPCAGVEAAGGEHARIGVQRQVHIGQHDMYEAGPVRCVRLLSEVVVAH